MNEASCHRPAFAESEPCSFLQVAAANYSGNKGVHVWPPRSSSPEPKATRSYRCTEHLYVGSPTPNS